MLADALRDRFTLERELGRGGMATVYLAHDLKHDRRVALKVLRPELGAVLGGERFQREIGIAARLHHPLILPVFDSGSLPAADGAEACFWYAMPFVEGETLRDWLRRERQLGIEDAVRVGSEVAEALGYAHARGVLHRDVKPENILLSDGHALLADFGIALAVNVGGGERLTEAGLSLGTPAYMSPEQAAGDDHLDCRSDLYSLGCVLYEMVAGQPPFSGASARALMARHAIDPVPSLRTVRSNVPAGVEAAIQRALAKVPADRFGSGTELMRALQQGVRGPSVEPSPRDGVTRPTAKRAEVGAAPRRTLEAPTIALFGRTVECERMRQAWLTVEQARARCVVVSGVAGIGKTRLVEEFVRWVEPQGATVAVSRCYGTVGKLPYAPLADWLRSPAIRESLSELPEVWQTEVAGLIPDAGLQVSTTTSLGERSQLEARRRLFEATVQAIAAAPQPVLLFLDDVQWADRDTLEWLGYFLRVEASVRVLVLATLRLGELPLDDRLNTVLLDLRREGRMEEIALEPLGMAETADLAAAVGGARLEPRTAQELHRETEGHPLYIVEMVRARAAGASGGGVTGGAVTGHGDGHSLPQRVLATIEGRLAQLSASARTVIGVAAVIGREFGIDLLARSSGLSEIETASALDELLERRLIRERFGGTYDFSHDNIREVAYGGIGSARRRLLHHRIAEVQIASAAESRGLAATIAKHLELGGFVEEAIPHYQRAAEHALSLFAVAEATMHFDKAIELAQRLPASPGNLTQEIDLRTALCSVLLSTEGYAGPRALMEHASLRALCDRAGIPPAPALLRSLAHPLVIRGALAELRDVGERLLAAVPPGGDSILFVESQYVLGIAAFWRGEPAAAADHFQAALDAYRPEHVREHIRIYGQDPAAVCGVRLGYALWMLDQPVLARRAVDEAVARAESLSHPLTTQYVRIYGVLVLILLEEEEAARRLLDSAIQSEANASLGGWYAMNRMLEGFLLAREGHAERGIAMMEQAALEYAGRGVKLQVPMDRTLLARACLAADRPEEALHALEGGTAVARETGQHYADAELLRVRAELVAASGGDTGEVHRLLQDAIDIATGQGAAALVARARRTLQRLQGHTDDPETWGSAPTQEA